MFSEHNQKRKKKKLKEEEKKKKVTCSCCYGTFKYSDINKETFCSTNNQQRNKKEQTMGHHSSTFLN